MVCWTWCRKFNFRHGLGYSKFVISLITPLYCGVLIQGLASSICQNSWDRQPMSLEIEICYSVGLLEANNLNLPRWKDHVVYNVDSCGDSFRREVVLCGNIQRIHRLIKLNVAFVLFYLGFESDSCVFI